MRLIDADALKTFSAMRYEFKTTNGTPYYVEAIPVDELDAAPTVCCEECRFLEVVWTNNRGEEGHGCGHPDVDEACAAGEYDFVPPAGYGCSCFERRQP